MCFTTRQSLVNTINALRRSILSAEERPLCKEQYVQSAWETYTKAVWPRDGRASAKGLQLVIDMVVEEGLLKKPVKPEDVIDHSYLQEIGAR